MESDGCDWVLKGSCTWIYGFCRLLEGRKVNESKCRVYLEGMIL